MSREMYSTRSQWKWIRSHSKMLLDMFMVLLCLFFLSAQFGRKEVLRTQQDCRVQQPAGAGSPLRDVVLQKFKFQPLSEEEQELVEEILQLSDLQLQTMVIAETVVPLAEHEKLIESVEKQLAMSGDVIGREQVSAVIEMLRLLPSESSLLKESAGDQGSLSSYAMVALVKQHDSNLHFMLAAMRAEPHLRWRTISTKRRNEWRSALARFLIQRVVSEVKNNLLHQNNSRVHADQSAYEDQ